MAEASGNPGYADVNALPAVRNLEGAAWMIAAGVMFTTFVTLSKSLSAEFDPGFLAFWRSLIGVILLLPLLARQGFGLLKMHRPGLMLTRSLFSTFGFVLGFYAVSDAMGLTLAEFNGISFSRALFVTLLAALLLGERVGVHRWGATLVGFVGVMIMANLSGGISLGALLALAAAASLACGITLVKSLSADHRPMTLLIWANILSSLLILPWAIMNWPDFQMSLQQWSGISVMSLTAVIGQYFFIRAMSVGDASFLSPIDYLRLPMAAGVDLLIFRVLPGLNLWIGAALIVGSTFYITLRERRLKQRQENQTPPM